MDPFRRQHRRTSCLRVAHPLFVFSSKTVGIAVKKHVSIALTNAESRDTTAGIQTRSERRPKYHRTIPISATISGYQMDTAMTTTTWKNAFSTAEIVSHREDGREMDAGSVRFMSSSAYLCCSVSKRSGEACTNTDVNPPCPCFLLPLQVAWTHVWMRSTPAVSLTETNATLSLRTAIFGLFVWTLSTKRPRRRRPSSIALAPLKILEMVGATTSITTNSVFSMVAIVVHQAVLEDLAGHMSTTAKIPTLPSTALSATWITWVMASATALRIPKSASTMEETAANGRARTLFICVEYIFLTARVLCHTTPPQR